MITTKEEMSKVAVSLFKQDGFENISVAKICEALNVTRGSFYHHFESKNELLLFWFTKNAQQFVHFDRTISSPKATLKKFILDYASLITLIGKDLMYFIFMAELELKGEHFYIYYGERQEFKELVDLAKEKGEITSLIETKQLMDMFSAAFLGTVVLWRFHQDELNIIDNVEQIFETIYK
ncbi:TetR/AcrR family transcriptional regulator [Solibacillus sp. A46]|uniref:TetR/AcrR family transcriptional regulator n=1 Tax=Solibacillus faecavium TaxID=2762221 RepID=A0ABR8XW35_9BACL|nr:TetR/AcrR family transcriptional regulator [Solibacillus faecavium]MBD8036150.1 TetR/AcrR family transcriptional regulator [Solibacillus faecavium]